MDAESIVNFGIGSRPQSPVGSLVVNINIDRFTNVILLQKSKQHLM